MNQRTQNIIDRFRRYVDHPATAALRNAAEKSLAISEVFAQQGKSIARDPNLSAQGRTSALEAAVKIHARDLREARRPIVEARERVKEMRAKIKPTAINRSDVTAELRRAEVRAFVRSLGSKQKMELLSEGNQDVLDAILDQPAAISGIPPEVYAAARDAREQKLHGPLLSEISDLEAIIGEADAAALVARGDLKATMNTDAETFEKIVSPIEKRAGAPWLLNRDGKILRIRPEARGTSEFQIPATDDEIRDGQFFDGEAAYRANLAA